jgi:chromosomal replication initiation ATPase DnaA
VDEANRLCVQGLEVLRDVFDGGRMGLVLLGHAGLKPKVLAQPALASRVGVRYVFEGLSAEEVSQLLQEYVQESGVEMSDDVIYVIVEKTQGNMQKVRLVLKQIRYLLRINKLSKLTKRVVEVACSQLQG